MMNSESHGKLSEELFLQAEQAWQKKHVEQALNLYLAAVHADHSCHAAHRALAMIFDMVHKPRLAIRHMEYAVDAAPQNAEYHFQLGTFLFLRKSFDAARRHLEITLRLAPNHHKARNHLGVVLTNTGLPHEAQKHFTRCLTAQPDNYKYQTNLASALINQGKICEALSQYEKALKLQPSYPLAGSNYLFALNYHPSTDQASLLRESRAWEKRLRSALPVGDFTSAKTSSASRPRRIGYVSADFRTHSVGWFIAPVLTHHDREKFEIICYANVAAPDPLTERMRENCTKWRTIFGKSDQEVCEMIRGDAVDILVDLGGHTAENRLAVFLHRNAPLQLSWLGYPATTGLSTIDFRITDMTADPDGQEAYHSESLFRLPEGFLCYEPPENSPLVKRPPCVTNGYITFGSFNNLPKINRDVVSAWSRLLHRVPHSRLLLKNRFFTDPAVCTWYLEQFSALGIDTSRLTFHGYTCETKEHLSLYNSIDIALDTFPYNGTTTTCEALWMGVPVVGLTGNRHAARVGYSILNSVALADLAAGSEQEYVDTARRLARSPETLIHLRETMRTRMRHSCLCDAQKFTRILENAYCQMWQSRQGIG
ncbi:MAG: tetratricopeptide repeat protein [Chitinivibrionales bacterium]